MLKLTGITKDYPSGDTTVHALKGVSIAFRENEFVSILGPSGCGKTTLLNLIGGLDHYTDGDMTISGVSTKDYKDADWDSYRNHSVGFVFQSYNLIPHQSVLANVELALTLSGVGKAERRRRAIAALEKVGLGDQLKKRPNQMSGGQMQRVAIARALVNDPEILLADEPTGALDSETSTQVMDLLREVAQDRLVIMVTHNAELAEEYSTRIVRLLDGQVVGDTDPFDGEISQRQGMDHRKKHTTMRFFTALGLSTNNLMTKKGRTLLTAFAGSIGIIGIALILSLSSGVQNYIDDVQEETLSSYPITILAEETDMNSLMASMMGVEESEAANHEKDAVYSNAVMYELMNTMMNADTKTNNLRDFKVFLDDMENNGLKDYVSSVQYSYNLSLNVYARDENDVWCKSDPLALWEGMMGEGSVYSGISSMYSGFSTLTCWRELLKGEDGGLVAQSTQDEYELLYGQWPQAYNEIVLMVSDNNEISDLILYSLGLTSQEDMMNVMTSALARKEVDSTQGRWSYEEICGIDLRLLLPTDYYVKENGAWQDISGTQRLLDLAIADAVPLKIVGVVRSAEADPTQTGVLAYTTALTEYVINETNASQIVQEQKDPANENYDVLTGLPFTLDETDETEAETAAQVRDYMTAMDDEAKAQAYLDLASQPAEADVQQAVDAMLADLPDRADLEALILDNYAAESGMSADTISSYMANLSDEELHDLVAEGVKEQLTQQFAEQTRQALLDTAAQGMTAAPDAQLEQAAQMAAQQVLAQTSRNEYIIGAYMQSTAMDAQTIAMWVMSQDEATLDAIFNAQMLELAKSYLPESQGVDEAALAPVLAPMLDSYLAALSDGDAAGLYDAYMPPRKSDSTLEDNLKTLGVLDLASPSSINIYTQTFASKDAIADVIDQYNQTRAEEDQISYTDYVALLMSSITKVINAISYVLVAFVSISLVVSSIMIGIITYISVLERTKEIGILRAIGAAKKDVGRVFNAETLIVGFAAGVIGIGVTLLLNIPINAIILHLTDISNLRAVLPWQGAVILVAISVGLTVIAGLIPSGIAARKDPVEALRTE